MKTSPETIARLRKLCEKATPGPWEWRGDNCLDGPPREYEILEAGDDGKGYGMHSPLIAHDFRPDKKDANKAIITESRNALPALLDDLEAMRKACEMALRELQASGLCYDHPDCVQLRAALEAQP